jgi:hypothetical protein
METNKHVVYTSVNFNYLGRALTLARSVKRHDPSVHFVLLLVEPEFVFTTEVIQEIMNCDGGGIFDEILTINELGIFQNNQFLSYSVVEMCTAVKGQAAVNLLARKTSQFVTYLDPDLYFYNSLEQIRNAHLNPDVLLTPHLNHIPYLDDIIRNDEVAGVMRHGLYNLGFVSFKNTKNGRDVAAWWADRLNVSSSADYENGLFTDQKWWDLSQIYFQNTLVVKNDGWNMAPWNVSERRLISVDPPRLDSGDDLFFFHFSKYPSKAFDDKVYSQGKSILLKELVKEYGLLFKESEKYVEGLLRRIDNFVKSTQIPEKLENGRQVSFGNILRKILGYLEGNTYIRKVVINISLIRRLAIKAHHVLDRFIQRVDLTARHSFNLGDLGQLNLDLLIISHQGGGGVGEVVKERIQECLRSEISVGVLRPNPSGGLTLSLNNSPLMVIHEDDVSKLIDRPVNIEIHHVLGLEYLLEKLSEKKISTIYLHDKYFLTQVPFSDTLESISVSRDIPGVNSPLNRNSGFSEKIWLDKSARILFNSASVRAPSKYLADQYKLIFPKLEVEHFQLEHQFEASRPKSIGDYKENVILISPTGLHKGSSILADVARFFVSEKPSMKFRVFGDLEISTEEELKKIKNIDLHGQISRPRLNNALATSAPSLGWIPSLTGESYSLALSDFLANGLTVIAAKTGALPERLAGVPGHYLYNPAITTLQLGRLIIAISENADLGEFATFLEIT